MTLQDCGLQYRRLRAPQRHGETLVDPSIDVAAVSVAHNRCIAGQRDGDFLGMSAAALTEMARRDMLARAERYTSAYRDQATATVDLSRILLTGHQPQLFHPGVWFKNFVAWELGGRCQANVVHLLIDNDTLGSPTIRVPGGSVSAPTAKYIELDQTAAPIPFEERKVLDRSLFESFASRVLQSVGPLLPGRPLVSQLWPMAVESLRRTGNLGQAVAEARHRIEAEWGVATLEVPFSQLCDSVPFRRFMVSLCCELPYLVDVYNSTLLEYRKVHRIRSRSHPVPQLSRQTDWLEAPFWIWSRTDPRRRRLFVRRQNDQLELSDRGQQTLRLPLSAGCGEGALQRLAEASAAGCRIRSRALTTTMYARLFLGDYFLHGIGGAKYDQLTDSIIRRFFDWEPPEFGIATATLQLPIERPVVESEQLRSVEQQLRDLHFHPEHFVPDTPETSSLIAEKQRWISTELPRGRRRPRHDGIAAANQALQAWLADQRGVMRHQRDQLRSKLRNEKLLGSREFSLCLFPARTLRPVLLDF